MLAEMSFAIDFHIILLFLRNMSWSKNVMIMNKKEQRTKLEKEQSENTKPLIQNQPSDS